MPDSDLLEAVNDAPDGLIAPANDIFDRVAVEAEIERAADEAPDAAAIRKATVAALNAAQTHGRNLIKAQFLAKPRAAREAVQSYAWLTDCLVQTVFRVAVKRLHPQPNPTASQKMAVLAVGGYGRFEMAPYSDVDLLFLTPYKITGWAESVIESMLYMLWDLHLKVGHSSRTIKDCLRLGKEDFTIRTAMLEVRYVDGDFDLAQELAARLFDDLFDGTAPEFIEAKLEERTQRHKKQGGQRYVVEPNVKEGKGGLRDLQTLIWVAKYLHRVVRARELRDVGMFTDEEYANFAEANNFLWAVRCHLHLIAGRAMDQLTFDLQLEVAERMGYVDKGGRQAVEHFMQDYFLHATQVGELTRIFLTGLENEHLKKEPMLVGLFKRRKKVKPGYKIENGRLTFEDEAAFLSDKLNLLRIFEEGLRTGVLIHPDAMRVVTAHLDLIDDDMRDDREASRIFLDLLLKHGNPERALRRMNELGVLSAFVPEFEPIVAMMQFNMYHSYTVDEHTIQVISALAEIERGERLEELPYASRILKEGVNRKVLYVALFCHDIGKGREEDHSILGARIARKVATRLGLTKPEVETVEWLVRYHLLMSDVAQKRDLSDPRTIRGFAKAVSNKKRLDLLLVLTACDIRGVGPGTWNNWKAALLRDLYRQTAQALDEGIEALNTTARTNEAKKALREALADWERKDLRVETGRHYDTYWQGLGNAEHVVFANLLNGLGADEIRIGLTQDHDRDATRAAFVLADHPGIFSRLAGALALVGANVVDARTYTTKDGWATAVFWVQDHDGHPFEDIKLKRLEDMIHKTLSGKVIARDAMKSRDKMKKREKAFTVPTNITFDNDGSDIYTMIEVDTRDRPGLLYDLTRTLADNHVYIASAVIATYGEQVVDTFYVKDMFGLKFFSDAKMKSLEKKLREAIVKGAERADQ
ncbi:MULTISPECIES: [protein-PII] uridylyltransferase [Maritimibacter]|uniref:Bifunctional uridylyltransferase/uridylyl-removing enzyme n=1 Tax=Maritimibacter alkaliphilus HTCC2654 TaxID=314271 RepID=A3VHY0_9RHOB|nr:MULTISPECIES: [protein-PII] uridylyltransferase [Maritimibacter]EAQ12321.1 PII uridylyl-transferase [Rhodobacterales bacterium HTCC2654] [Maritimibacter alkaliphilus HTCC2654]TYP85392.1 UTP--GlnB (protein PII) uridylyltransferase GlnD [Maritimibacter alkaliphilus HTCC2654]